LRRRYLNRLFEERIIKRIGFTFPFKLAAPLAVVNAFKTHLFACEALGAALYPAGLLTLASTADAPLFRAAYGLASERHRLVRDVYGLPVQVKACAAIALLRTVPTVVFSIIFFTHRGAGP
jgi:hypothetical protein